MIRHARRFAGSTTDLGTAWLPGDGSLGTDTWNRPLIALEHELDAPRPGGPVMAITGDLTGTIVVVSVTLDFVQEQHLSRQQINISEKPIR